MGRKIRQILLITLGLVSMRSGKAQTFSEWFRQNSTRLKYYARQIAALQVYLGELGKGYQIADVGLGSIGNSEQGEMDSHSSYYASLGTINPVVGRLAEVAEIVALQASIIGRFMNALGRYRRDGLLGADRVTHIELVYGDVLRAGLEDIRLLVAVLTTGNWQMTDDERIITIRQVDADMRQRYSFTQAFIDGSDILERQLVAERANLGMVRDFYGIP